MSAPSWDPREFKITTRPDGRKVIESPQPFCDFCLSADVKWEFPATTMPIVGHPLIGESQDEWAACDGCRELVDAHKLGALVERCIAGHKAAERPAFVKIKPMPIWRRELRENLLRFMDARTGPARPYQP